MVANPGLERVAPVALNGIKPAVVIGFISALPGWKFFAGNGALAVVHRLENIRLPVGVGELDLPVGHRVQYLSGAGCRGPVPGAVRDDSEASNPFLGVVIARHARPIAYQHTSASLGEVVGSNPCHAEGGRHF